MEPTYEELKRRCEEYKHAISVLGFFFLPWLEAVVKIPDGYRFDDLKACESEFAKEYEEWRREHVQDNEHGN